MQIRKTALLSMLLLLVDISESCLAQDITGDDLLNKAIAYHDPNNHWGKFKANIIIDLSMPNSKNRVTHLILDLPASYFKSTVKKGEHTVQSVLKKDECILKLDGTTEIPEKLKDSLRITCERARMMKDYYTYLYGLPMKLKDQGTIVHQKVKRKIFKGKEYLALKVNYDESVGKDTWYFYFDPTTYAMEIYQFYRDESKNDGEYITLSDTVKINGIIMPKIRAWYYNKDDKYLGTDSILEANPL